MIDRRVTDFTISVFERPGVCDKNYCFCFRFGLLADRGAFVGEQMRR